jgi:hypothetical protein
LFGIIGGESLLIRDSGTITESGTDSRGPA